MFSDSKEELVFHVFVPDEHRRVKVKSKSTSINTGMYLQMILSGLVSIVIIVLSALIIGNVAQLNSHDTSYPYIGSL
jgi:hypothetical protein